jgi:hypothetical protein
MVRQGQVWRGQARQGSWAVLLNKCSRFYLARLGQPRSGSAGFGGVLQGPAGSGRHRFGAVWHAAARLGKARIHG